MRRTISVLFSLVWLVFFSVCIHSQTPVPSITPQIPRNEADLIHFGDLIDVDFAGSLEYDWRGSLTSSGFLDGLDEFSPIAGLCRSETDVATDIARAYSKILRDPKVTVKIIDRSNRAVALLDGAVKMPTRFRIQRIVRLRELIVLAGGFSDYASGEIVIFRPSDLNCSVPLTSDKGPSGNGLQTINISISELLAGKQAADPVVLSGDMVTVGKAVLIYVIGAVNNPRPIYAHSGMTLTRAIATAGGLAKEASGQKVSIFRRVKTETSVMQADLEKMKNGEINDVDLKPFDIIEVTFKGRAPRKYPPVLGIGENNERDTPDLPLQIID